MQKSKLIAFRATPEQRQKLELLALGEETTLSGVIVKLLDTVPVKSVQVVRGALALNKNIDSVVREDNHAVNVA